jgi:hypothetical protein
MIWAQPFRQMSGVKICHCIKSLLKPPGVWSGANQQNWTFLIEPQAFTSTDTRWQAVALESSSCAATWISLACRVAMGHMPPGSLTSCVVRGTSAVLLRMPRFCCTGWRAVESCRSGIQLLCRRILARPRLKALTPFLLVLADA